MRDWLDGASVAAESVTHSECPIRGSVADSEKPYGEWLKAGTRARNAQPSKDHSHARRNHRPSNAELPTSETEMPAETDTEKSTVQPKINSSSCFADQNSNFINSIKNSDPLPQLDEFITAAKHKTNPTRTPPHSTCLNTIFTPAHITDPTCLNTTFTPSQQQKLPTVTELKTFQPQTEINTTKNQRSHLFSVPITYGAKHTLHKTLLPPSHDKLKTDNPKEKTHLSSHNTESCRTTKLSESGRKETQ